MPTDNDVVMTRQIARALEKLREHWLVFPHGDAIEVLRRIRFLSKQPILMAHCERQPGYGAHTYEYFVVHSLTIQPTERLVAIHGTIGPNGARQTLYWSPDKLSDPSGTFITCVYTLSQYYPNERVKAVDLAPVSFES